MALNLYLSSTTSDLSGGSDFNNYLETTVGSTNSISVAFAKNGVASKTSYAFTRTSIPNIATWLSGSINVSINFTTINSDVYVSIQAHRISSSGVIQESTTISSEQQLSSAGSYTFALENKVWSSGSTSDRLRIDYIFRNNRTNAAKTIAFSTGALTFASIPSIYYKSLSANISTSNILNKNWVYKKSLTANIQTYSTKDSIKRQSGLWYIERKDGLDGVWTELSSDDVSPYEDNYNLTNEITYYYRVRQFLNGTFTPYSNEVSVNYTNTGTTIIPIGYCKLSNNQSIPIYNIADITDSVFRVSISNGVGCFKLVDITDSNASSLRIQTSLGVKAVLKDIII